MVKSKIILLYMTLAFTIIGCSVISENKKEKLFSEMYPGVVWNKELKLDYITAQGVNTGTIGRGVRFAIHNYSNDPILMKYNFGSAILYFESTNNQWVKIEDGTDYNDTNDVVIPIDKDAPPYGLLILPTINPSVESITLRVVITGVVLRDGSSTGDQVGAYTEITLKR